ncbi:MAG TPA: hypothetical protein VNJ04_12370 [Gemmatimonadaceae bacterium]|nr:hypothetical protein [Gemmatimonadaceae bacterium]
MSDRGVIHYPTLSGGSWQAALPLANLQDRALARVARSTNTLASSTQFEVDLKTARPVRVLALPRHAISFTGTIRVRASNTEGNFAAPLYDTGTVNVWPAGIDAEKVEGMNLGWTHVTPETVTAQYWLFEISDAGNTAGYLDLGRLVIAQGWQPSINMQYGAKLGLETATEREVTDGGAAVYSRRATRRTAMFTLDDLPDTEALESGFDMQRIAGTSGQLMFVFDPADTAQMHRRSFLAVLRELSALDHPYFNRNSIPFGLVEEL